MEDNRKKFKNEYWKQGCLFLTNTTSRWSDQRKDEVAQEEEKCCFVRFSWGDEGRSRVLVYKFKTRERCKKVIDKHNKKLDKLKKNEKSKTIL